MTSIKNEKVLLIYLQYDSVQLNMKSCPVLQYAGTFLHNNHRRKRSLLNAASIKRPNRIFYRIENNVIKIVQCGSLIEISEGGTILATENQQAIINDVIDVETGVCSKNLLIHKKSLEFPVRLCYHNIS